MADKYTKKAEESKEEAPVSADAWKSVMVEKEHQPAKQKSVVSYAQLESQKANLEAQKSDCESRIADIDAEMAKVKSAVEA